MPYLPAYVQLLQDWGAKGLEWLGEEVIPPITATGYRPVEDDPLEDLYNLALPRQRWEIGLEAATSPLIPSTLLSKGLRKALNASIREKAAKGMRLDLAKGGDEVISGTPVSLEDAIKRPDPKRNPRLEAREVKKSLSEAGEEADLGWGPGNIWDRINRLEDRAQMHYTAAGDLKKGHPDAHEHVTLARKWENEAKDLRKVAEEYPLKRAGIPYGRYKGELVEAGETLKFRSQDVIEKGVPTAKAKRGHQPVISIEDPVYAGGHEKVARLREQMAAAGDPYTKAGKDMGPYRKGAPVLPKTGSVGGSTGRTVSEGQPSLLQMVERGGRPHKSGITRPVAEPSVYTTIDSEQALEIAVKELEERMVQTRILRDNVPEHLRPAFDAELSESAKKYLELQQSKRITLE